MYVGVYVYVYVYVWVNWKLQKFQKIAHFVLCKWFCKIVHFNTLENYATDIRYCPRALTLFSSPSVGASPLSLPISYIFFPQKQGKGRMGGHYSIFFFSENSIVLMDGFPKSGNQFTIFAI